MKVYVDENDIKRNIITYCNGTNTQQGLYVFGKDKIEVLSLADYTKQVRKEVCEEIKEEVKKLIEKDFKLCNHEYANGYCYGLQYDLAKILEKIEKGEAR